MNFFSSFGTCSVMLAVINAAQGRWSLAGVSLAISLWCFTRNAMTERPAREIKKDHQARVRIIKASGKKLK